MRRNSLLAAVAAVFAVLVLVALRGGGPGPGAEKIAGLWACSLTPGRRIAVRMRPDGSCEFVAYFTDGSHYERSKSWRWRFEDDALLIYHFEGRHGFGSWGDDLYYALVGPDERLNILTLNDTEMTIDGYQGPLTYHRVESDPAFASAAD